MHADLRSGAVARDRGVEHALQRAAPVGQRGLLAGLAPRAAHRARAVGLAEEARERGGELVGPRAVERVPRLALLDELGDAGALGDDDRPLAKPSLDGGE